MKTVYTDAAEEYHALRHACGLLEHEGTGLVAVSGADAATFLRRVSTRTVDFLLEGQSASALLLTEAGTVLAEVLIHCRAGGYLVEVWPAQAPQAIAHLTAVAAEFPDTAVDDVSGRSAVFGLEGPESFRIAGRYLDFPVSAMNYRSFVPARWAAPGGDTELLVSRTGVTGEYGYKLHVPAEHADALRAELLDAGAVPVGLDALDTCRMEMRFANLEREAADGTATPFHLGLQWMVDFGHDFVGKEALLRQWEAGIDEAPVCWIAAPEIEVAPEGGLTLAVGGAPVGRVAHAVHSPSLGRVVGTARVARAVASSGVEFELGGTGAAVRTVSAPFLVATSFGVPME